ncbi:hypothetical protein HispidOSU_027765, partial [Sigmodon hispidus]
NFFRTGKEGAEDHSSPAQLRDSPHGRSPGPPALRIHGDPLRQGSPHSLVSRDGDPSHPLPGLQGCLGDLELHQLPAGEPPPRCS